MVFVQVAGRDIGKRQSKKISSSGRAHHKVETGPNPVSFSVWHKLHKKLKRERKSKHD